MTDQHTCPRRMEHFSPQRNEQGADLWRADHTCSYCGSLSGDRFMEEVEKGTEIGPTDKDYKAYLDVPNPNVGVNELFSSHTNPSPEAVERMKKDPSWIRESDTHWVQFRPAPAVMHAKFYFDHLSVDQRKRFVELLNAKQIKIGDPGRFYRIPFFIGRESA